jgi:hypothetical protein
VTAATLALAGCAALFLGSTAFAKTIYGTPGRDTTRGTTAADRATSAAGAIRAGAEAAGRLVGGPARDTLHGGERSDTNDAHDSHRNKLLDRRGRDRAVANTYDAMADRKYGDPPSFLAGPKGRSNRVPAAGAFLGLWRDGAGLTKAQARRLLRSRERFFRCEVDIMAGHYGAPKGRCYSIRALRQGN